MYNRVAMIPTPVLVPILGWRTPSLMSFTSESDITGKPVHFTLKRKCNCGYSTKLNMPMTKKCILSDFYFMCIGGLDELLDGER